MDSLAGKPEALLTMKVFAYRVAKYIGAYAAAMNGVDAIAFTAGLGEIISMSAQTSALTLAILELNWIRRKMRSADRMSLFSTPESKVAVMTIPTNEELAICRETVALLQ